MTSHRKEQSKKSKKVTEGPSFQPSLNSRSMKLAENRKYSPRDEFLSPPSQKNAIDIPKPRNKSMGDPDRLKRLYEQAQKRAEK